MFGPGRRVSRMIRWPVAGSVHSFGAACLSAEADELSPFSAARAEVYADANGNAIATTRKCQTCNRNEGILIRMGRNRGLRTKQLPDRSRFARIQRWPITAEFLHVQLPRSQVLTLLRARPQQSSYLRRRPQYEARAINSNVALAGSGT